MRSSRTLIAGALVIGALAAALIGWFGSGWRSLVREERAILAAARARAHDDAAQLAADLTARLEELRAEESLRPYYHYQNLFHDPRGASEGWSVAPSPLAAGPADPLVSAHFQIDPAGSISTPTDNRDVPETASPVAVADRALVAELTRVRAQLVRPPDPIQVALATPRPAVVPDDKPTVRRSTADKLALAETKDSYKAAKPSFDRKPTKKVSKTKAKSKPEPVPQVLLLDPDAYVQNVNSNDIFRDTKRRAVQAKTNQDAVQQQADPSIQQQANAPVQQQADPSIQQQASPSPIDQAPDPELDDQQVQQAAPAPQAVQAPEPIQASQPAPVPRPARVQRSAPARAAAVAEPAPVMITIEPLTWRSVPLDGAPALLAVRQVTTPDGTLTQGLVVSADHAREWLGERAGEDVDLVIGTPPAAGVATAVLGVGGAGWWVAVDERASVAAAGRVAAELRSAFLGRFIPIALLAAACGALVVLLTARAEKLARQRARFAAAAAHELRTPLAGIQLYGDMLVDGLGDPTKHRDYARRVAEEASRLGRVVANVLGFSQLERGSLAVRSERGDAAAAARDAVERARPALVRGGATVEVEVEGAADGEGDGEGEPVRARFDRDGLARILGNLLDNAEKYTREHDDRRITVSVRRAADDLVEIEVRDRGPGLPPALRRRRFEPFTRGTNEDGPPGLGLGLALSQSLARAMGGDLTWRDRDPGAGFVVSLRG